MPLLDGVYVPTSKENIFDKLELELQEEFGIEGDITNLSTLSAIVDAISETIHEQQEHELSSVYESAFLNSATGEDLDNVVEIIGVQRRTASHATGVITFARDTASEQSYTIQSGTTVQTSGPVPEKFETTQATTIEAGELTARANIRHVDGGEEGNVAADTITVMPSPPDGVDECYNQRQTGNPNTLDMNNNPMTVGRDGESDEQLRERAQITVTRGGAATADALVSALVNNEDLPGVESVSLYQNRTHTDNTGSGGLPPKSFELVVYGGRAVPICEAIFGTMSVTSHDYSGVHGTTTTRQVTGINGQNWDVSFSRPNTLEVDMEVSVVVTDEYTGDQAVKNTIVDYIGGTDTEGESVIGTGVGENIYLDTIEDEVIGVNDMGVRGISNLTTTPSSTTDSNGLSVVAVGNNEVAATNAADGSITVNTTVE